MQAFDEIWALLGDLELLVHIALNKSGSIPASVAGTGFWKSVSGILQPTASIGLPGQIPTTNQTGSNITWQDVFGSWVPISGGTFTPDNSQKAILADASGAQITINTPTDPYDGQDLVIYDYEGLSALNPIILVASPGQTIEDPSTPGEDPGASGHIGQQGMTAWFKYFASAGQWELMLATTPYVVSPNSWSTPTWFIDPSNVSGSASNKNPGTSSSKPLLNYSELVRRWGGTRSPILSGVASTTLTFLSGHPDATDPVILAPICDQVLFVTEGTLPTPLATGTLSGVVSKSIPANQALNADLPAGTVAGSLIVNSTRANSYARAFKNLGGNLWLISQPIAATAIPFIANPTEVDTWANGDSISVYSPATNAAATSSTNTVNLVTFQPVLSTSDSSLNNTPTLANINVGDVTGESFGLNVVNLGGGTLYLNCSFSTRCQLNATTIAIAANRFVGCDIGAGLNGGSPSQSTLFQAGQYRLVNNGWPLGAYLDADFVFAGQASQFDAINLDGIGTVYVDGGFIKITSPGLTFMQTTYNGAQPAVYGSGGLDARTALYYRGTAVNSFPCAGGLKIGGSSNAYSNATSAGTTTTHLVAITPAAIDAAAGAAGFGSMAYIPSQGCIATMGITP